MALFVTQIAAVLLSAAALLVPPHAAAPQRATIALYTLA